MSRKPRDLWRRIAQVILGILAVLVASSVFTLAATGHDIAPSGIADALELFIKGLQLIGEGLGATILLLI